MVRQPHDYFDGAFAPSRSHPQSATDPARARIVLDRGNERHPTHGLDPALSVILLSALSTPHDPAGWAQLSRPEKQVHNAKGGPGSDETVFDKGVINSEPHHSDRHAKPSEAQKNWVEHPTSARPPFSGSASSLVGFGRPLDKILDALVDQQFSAVWE